MRVRETHTYRSLFLSLGIMMTLCFSTASAASTPTLSHLDSASTRFPCSAFHESIERKRARHNREARHLCEAFPSPDCQEALQTRLAYLERLVAAIKNWREPRSTEVILAVLHALNPVDTAPMPQSTHLSP